MSKKVILDKTGTITVGKPKVADVIPLSGETQDDLLQLAASAEKPSEHPLAQAIVERCEEQGLMLRGTKDFQAVPGHGVRAVVDGARVLVGSLRFLKEEAIDVGVAREKAAELEASAKTVIAVADNGTVVGLLTIADEVKVDAVDAVTQMEMAGLTPIMLTGDNKQTAEAVASLVGIKEIYAQVLPQDKAAKVRELQQRGFRVAMVGDGINDAPALMQADVGVAIGAGTDIAIESSDVILVGERLGGFVDAYHIAKRSFRKTVQNLLLAFSFNGIGVPLATTGLVHPVWAMIAMVASVSTVLINSFAGRLLPKPVQRKIPESIGPVEELTFKVPTIHCEGCVQIIRDSLGRFPEVTKVEGEPTQKQIAVTVQKGSLPREQIAGEIAKLGHTIE